MISELCSNQEVNLAFLLRLRTLESCLSKCWACQLLSHMTFLKDLTLFVAADGGAEEQRVCQSPPLRGAGCEWVFIFGFFNSYIVYLHLFKFIYICTNL